MQQGVDLVSSFTLYVDVGALYGNAVLFLLTHNVPVMC